ncbi:MAG: dockerin type I repeat-containing protein [Ruminococcus sp.]|nr:dockerin type I repeat-containing protein [Ruminococcus sp.]
MKKIVSFVLVTIILFSAFAIGANATVVAYIYGDLTKDKKVDVFDATRIQRHLARINELIGIDREIADFDNDKQATILDATAIQLCSAKLMENPRDNDNYLEFYVGIDDLVISPSKPYEKHSVCFSAMFDDVYNPFKDTFVDYHFTVTEVTDGINREVHSEHSQRPYIYYSFPEEGIYDVEFKVSKLGHNGTYTITKRVEVVPFYVYEFDQKRFVNNVNSLDPWEYPYAPEDAKEIEYERVLNTQAWLVTDKYGDNDISIDFVALVHTKEEYDKLFRIDNRVYTDEFFETKSLVVAVSPGYEHSDYSPIEGLYSKDGVLYIKVIYANSRPEGDMMEESAPTWYSFVAVDKADVEDIESVQRVRW